MARARPARVTLEFSPQGCELESLSWLNESPKPLEATEQRGLWGLKPTRREPSREMESGWSWEPGASPARPGVKRFYFWMFITWANKFAFWLKPVWGFIFLSLLIQRGLMLVHDHKSFKKHEARRRLNSPPAKHSKNLPFQNLTAKNFAWSIVKGRGEIPSSMDLASTMDRATVWLLQMVLSAATQQGPVTFILPP